MEPNSTGIIKTTWELFELGNAFFEAGLKRDGINPSEIMKKLEEADIYTHLEFFNRWRRLHGVNTDH